MSNLAELRGDLYRLRARAGGRDQRMERIAMVRRPGGLARVYPELFPEDAVYAEPIVANMVDIAARDISEVLAPLPAFNCSSSLSVSDRARKFAEKRTKIAYGYIDSSNLSVNSYVAADRYVSFGFVPAVVRLDFDRKTPVIQFLDSRGCYWHRDQWGRVTRLFQVLKVYRDDALVQFPHLRKLLDDNYKQDGIIELVRVWDDTHEVMFCNVGEGEICTAVTNPIGKAPVVVFMRPGLSDDDPIGQFDDAIPVQVAKAVFALLNLEAAHKAVQAPMAVPQDIQEFSTGPDAVIRTAFPEKVRRVGLEVPQASFAQAALLDNELRQGSRYPDVRTGNTDASVVTGRGVQALMTGFDTQIKTGNAVFAHGYTQLLGFCFQLDEKVWPNTERTLRGNANGTPYEIKYLPEKDIKGDYTVDVQYGLMAGLNPNQALVFGLQARGDKLISRDFLRRQMPMALDAQQEEQKVDIEELREALKQAVAAYAQAIPALAEQGQDPSQILARVAKIISDRQRGVAVEESIAAVFAPEPAPPAPAAPDMTGGMGGPGGGGGGSIGMDGLMPGVAPGQAGMSPGGSPDIMTLLAGLNSRGNPNMNAGISRRLPI